MPAIDISVKELAKKHAEDAATSINWIPPYSRIKIQPDPESKSGKIITLDNRRDTFVRGTILAVGPGVGLREGKREHTFVPGQRIIYNQTHELKYKGTDGIEHIFLRDDMDSIVGYEEVKETK